MSGSIYNRNKDSFKAILREHGLAWKGNREYFIWNSKAEKVVAEYDRDEAQGITLACRLNWEGPDGSPLLPALRAWAAKVGAAAAEGSSAAPAPRPPAGDQRLWEAVFRPPVERMRAGGAPPTWITKELQLFEEEKSRRAGSGT